MNELRFVAACLQGGGRIFRRLNRSEKAPPRHAAKRKKPFIGGLHPFPKN